MSDNKYSVEDLVAAATQETPVEFENIFNDLIVDRLQNAVENRKAEMAQTMFNPASSEEQEDFEQDQEPEVVDTEIESETSEDEEQ
jgi:hypothetical protein